MKLSLSLYYNNIFKFNFHLIKEEKIKILFLINDLNFFCTHRLPLAEAAKVEGFDVVIGYGEIAGLIQTN